MESLLNGTTERDLLSIFVPSYNRPDFVTGRNIFSEFTKEALRKCFLVVRAEQENAYYRSNKQLIRRGLNLIVIPKGKVSGVGSTRQFIMDYAVSHRLAYIMDMDDDVTRLHFLYSGHTKAGNPSSKHCGKMILNDERSVPQKILQLTGRISREVFKAHPDVLLGGMRRVKFSMVPEYSRTKYFINKGPTPRGIKALNMRGIYRVGIRMPDVFNLHGDDIGFAAEVLQRGYSCFNIPCLCCDFIDENKDSVVRDPQNPEKNRPLHKLEYDGLMQMEIKHYLRETFKFPDGQYKFGDIAWRRYHKLHGTKPIIESW